ncbi:hypothetical protein NBRC116494_27140 [Aurantivibrio plasticivorans]
MGSTSISGPASKPPAYKWYMDARTIRSIIVFLVALLVVLAAINRWVISVDRWLYDQVVSHMPMTADPSVVLIAIDEKSLRSLGRWPWPRHHHATLVDKLTEAGAASIVFDIVFADANTLDPQSDQAFIDAVANSQRVVLPVIFEPTMAGGQLLERPPFPALSDNTDFIGHVHVGMEDDGVVRGVYLQEGIGDAFWPHLSLAMQKSLGIREQSLPGLRQTSPGADDARPMQYVRDYFNWVPVRSGASDYLEVSYIDVLNQTIPDAVFSNKIVLVGMMASGLTDTFYTPTGVMPGVKFNANVFSAVSKNQLIVPLTPVFVAIYSGVVMLLAGAYFSVLAARRFLLVTAVAVAAVIAISVALLWVGNIWVMPGALLCGLLLFYPIWNLRKLELTSHYLQASLDALEPELIVSRERFPSTIEYYQHSFNYLNGLGVVGRWRLAKIEKGEATSSKTTEDGSDLTQSSFSDSDDLEYPELVGEATTFEVDGAEYRIKFHWNTDDKVLQSAVLKRIITNKPQFNTRTIQHPSTQPVVEQTLRKLRNANKVAAYNRSLIEGSIQQLPDAVVIADAMGRILHVNNQASQLWQKTPSEDDLLEIANEFEYLEEFSWPNVLTELAFLDKPFIQELIHTRLNRYYIGQGQKVDLGQKNAPVIMLTFTDITALRQSEQARMEALHFLSHDLRSPMTSVLALIDQERNVLTDSLDESRSPSSAIKRQVQLLNSIESYVQKNLGYAQQFLQIAKAKEIKPSDFVLCDLRDILDNAIDEVFPRAQLKGVKLERQLGADSVNVSVVPTLLERVIINLLDNAIKHSEGGSITRIDVDLSEKQGRGEPGVRYALVSIQDHGSGMSQELTSKIFERFRSEEYQSHKGIGLGLHFVQVVCRQHNIDIHVESTPGVGTTFTLQVPYSTS